MDIGVERIRRWEALMDGVRRFDVKGWRDSFVEALKASRQPRQPPIELTTAAKLRDGTEGLGSGEAPVLARETAIQRIARPQRPRRVAISSVQ